MPAQMLAAPAVAVLAAPVAQGRHGPLVHIIFGLFAALVIAGLVTLGLVSQRRRGGRAGQADGGNAPAQPADNQEGEPEGGDPVGSGPAGDDDGHTVSDEREHHAQSL